MFQVTSLIDLDIMKSFQAVVALIVEVIVAHRVIAVVLVVALVVVNCVMVAEIFV